MTSHDATAQSLRSSLAALRMVVACTIFAGFGGPRAEAATVLVEAESFADRGGWTLDTQFIEQMGSPYLLAHGLGKPVADATTKVAIAAAGDYRVFVRTKDWVARWNAPGTPGRFQVVVNGKPLAETFGTTGAQWGWQDGGTVTLGPGEATVALHDLTGFEGRCDCIAFTTDAAPPPNDSAVLAEWRRTALCLPTESEVKGPYDLIVIGGGYSGMGAAISAARMGLKVALVQDRPVLGGNGSSEVRVWAMGLIRRGKYPRIGEIIEEFCDHAKKSPGTYQEFGDAKKEAIVRAEPNIDLFLNMHAFAVSLEKGRPEDGLQDGQRIKSVTCLDTKTSRELRFTGRFFCDATGHATIGHLAGAETVMEPKDRMGMSNMWAWNETDGSQSFPATPWALPLTMADFPYPRDFHGEWFWESGFDKDPLADAEGIRDWNLRAVYGAFNAMKNGDGADKHCDSHVGRRDWRPPGEPANRRRRDALAGRRRGQARVFRRLRALHMVDRPALSQGRIRAEVPRQPVHFDRQIRQPDRPGLRLSSPLPLLLLQEHRQPLHGRPLHFRHARSARHRPRDENLRDDG